MNKKYLKKIYNLLEVINDSDELYIIDGLNGVITQYAIGNASDYNLTDYIIQYINPYVNPKTTSITLKALDEFSDEIRSNKKIKDKDHLLISISRIRDNVISELAEHITKVTKEGL